MTQNARKTVRTLAMMVIILSMFIVLMLSCSWYATHYTRHGMVIESKDNIITIVDSANYKWSIVNDDNYCVGDWVEMLMYTNSTDSNVDDDEIENIKKVQK